LVAMNLYSKISALLYFTLLLSTTEFVQAQSTDSIRLKFEKFRTNNLQEKIYVHTDRSSYLVGETIWFKVYLTDASLHKPLSLSSVVYVEIVTASQEIVMQTKISMVGGHGTGSIYLPSTINSNNYIIRAYTNWMKNTDAAFYFQKTITILNTFKSLESSPVEVPAPDVQFFPEGGNLIDGVKSKVAFRAINNSGKGIDFTGYLLNEKQDTLTTFTPLKFGIGSFLFTPTAGHTYHALIRERSGKTFSVNLPSALEDGYALQLIDSLPDKIYVRISANQPAPANLPLYLLIHARQIIVKAERIAVQNNLTLAINKKELPEGISHITLFDTDQNPVCERLYFTQPKNLNITLTTEQEHYVERRRVKLDIETTHSGTGKAAMLSASVYRIDSIPEHTTSMTSYMWLSADLHGQVESPEYYLTESPEAKEALDNLMLSHGWRRFTWNELLNQKNKILQFLPEHQNHTIRGLVKNPDGTPAPRVLTYLTSPGRSIRLYCSQSNSNGEIYFNMLDFTGTRKIYLQTNPTIDSLHTLEIVSPFSDKYSTWTLPPLTLTPSSETTLLSRSVAMQIQDIYFRNDPIVSTSDTSTFYGRADETYYLDAYTRFPVMEEVLREYVRGVMVRKRKDGFYFRLLDKVYNRIFTDVPLVIIDGLPVFDADEIMAFDPLKIKRLDVMTRMYYLSSFYFSGVVSFSTYQGDLAEFPVQPNCVNLNYEGLQLQREFYSPRYETPKQRETPLPDQRTLLYWNPSVQTDSNGKALVDFFTSDIAGDFVIRVEGLTPSGVVGSSTKRFTVKPANN